MGGLICSCGTFLLKPSRGPSKTWCVSCAKHARRAAVAKWRRLNPGHDKKRYLENFEAINARQKKWYAEHREAVKTYSKKHYADNLEMMRARSRAWYAKNSETVKVSHKAWRNSNPEKVRELARRGYLRNYIEGTPQKIASVLRLRLRQTVKGNYRSISAMKLLGMELPEFRIYIRGQFRDGMTWENHGPVWHLDHIRPCASFDLRDSEQQKICFRWDNIQPLLKSENLQKSDSWVD